MVKQKILATLSNITSVRVQVDGYRQRFQDLKPWWPILIPFLLWRGKRAYDRELKAVGIKLGEAALKKAQEQHKLEQQQTKLIETQAKINQKTKKGRN